MTAPGSPVLAALSPAVRDVWAALEAARDAVHLGRDPDDLATVEVDGSGRVTAVRLVPTISRQPAEAIARAVRTAYADAEAQRMAALQDVGRLARRTGGSR